MTVKPTILIVDDTPENLRLLGSILEQTYEILVATNGPDALRIAVTSPPAVILLDIMMPGMSGFEVCRELKAYPGTRMVPVLFISALDAHDQKVRAFSEGGVDYITKPFNADEVAARVRTHIRLSQMDELTREVAERMRAEEELRKIETRERILIERLSLAVESAGIGVWDYDIVQDRLTWDEQMYRLYRVPPEDFSGAYDAWERSIHPDDVARSNEEVQLAIRGEKPFDTEFLIYWPDGEVRHIKANARVVRNELGEPVRMTGINYDISDHKRSEAEREELQQQLRHIQKMEAIGVLAGGIAHDFNNILGVIVGHAELLRQDACEQQQPDWSSLEEIIRATTRATELVRQILTFSRRTESRKEPIRLAAIVQETVKLLRGVLPSNIEIRQHLGAPKGTLLGDPTHMHQVLMNLFTNASHAIGERGGAVTVGLQETRLEPGDVRLKLGLQDGDYLELWVSDTGCGVPPEHLDRIFEPFFTSKGLNEGTGLGLSVVHGIVSDHGGVITVETTLGKGTTFRILLPRIDVAADSDANVSPPCAPPRGHGRILLVDDDEAILRATSGLLVTLGYQTTSKMSAQDALELLMADHEAFDLVLTDLMMPHMTGPELRQRLVEGGIDVPILLATGYNETISTKAAKEMGFQDLLLKPIGIHELAAAVRRALKHEEQAVSDIGPP